MAKKTTQELIDLWGSREYPEHAGKKFRLSVEKGSDGYCETCWNEYAYLSVQADNKEIAELTYISMVDLMTDILSFDVE